MKAKIGAYIVAVCIMGTGCAPYGELEKDYGNSFNSAKNGQILNPAASRNLNPVTGVYGETAELTMEKYIGSFARDPKSAGQKGSGAPGTPGITGGQESHGK